jgi:hypothetical protein
VLRELAIQLGPDQADLCIGINSNERLRHKHTLDAEKTWESDCTDCS